MADNSNILAALKGVDPADAMPFGVGATPEGSPTALSSMLSGVMNLPKHLLENSQNSLDTGNYDPKVPVSAALTLMGGAAPAAEAGAAGIFGGKLARTADIDKLIYANGMRKEGIHPDKILGETGWFKSPADDKWKFEIPDNNSRMISHGLDYSQEGRFFTGPAEAMFQHPELYKAYPELKNVKMYNTVYGNPPNGVGKGSYDMNARVANIAAPDLANARSVALHELQHGVQGVENFARGGDPRYMALLQEKTPLKLPLPLQNADPHQIYGSLAGEVEARNVQKRMDFEPYERKLVPPWDSHDLAYTYQSLYNPTNDMVSLLRNKFK